MIKGHFPIRKCNALVHACILHYMWLCWMACFICCNKKITIYNLYAIGNAERSICTIFIHCHYRTYRKNFCQIFVKKKSLRFSNGKISNVKKRVQNNVNDCKKDMDTFDLVAYSIFFYGTLLFRHRKLIFMIISFVRIQWITTIISGKKTSSENKVNRSFSFCLLH